MDQFDQATRRFGVSTPLGENALVLTAFEGVEELSKCFELRLSMMSADDAISPRDIVGQNVTVTLLDPDDEPRFFNGYVRDFTNHGSGDRATAYTATIVPLLWFLRLRSDCRIFQDKTVPDVLEEVFKAAGLHHYDISGLQGDYPEMDYCVQYRETDFDFVSRLMEREGIFYTFVHEDGRHVLALGDHAGAYRDCKHGRVRYTGPTSFEEVGDEITAWEHRHEFTAGRVAHADFDFERPSAPVSGKEQTVLDLTGIKNNELYDFPSGRLDDSAASALARVRMEQLECACDVVRGGSRCRSFSPGSKFTVEAHHLAAEEGKQWTLRRVQHSVSAMAYVSGGAAPEPYENTFECIPVDITWRPARTTAPALVRGPQTAIVVGPAGEEIYTDEHGRVKVKFHWDRSENADDTSSCWIRVSQSWAGRRWGAIFLPRIGQEVIVDFLEGDPDRPIITGRVYNGDNTPPYTLPDHKTISGVKTGTTPGAGGFNEIRFEDKKGEEQIFVHGEKNLDIRIKNDTFELIGNDRHLIVKKDQIEHVENNREELVDNDHKEKIGKDRNLKVVGKEAKEVGKSLSLTVKDDVIEVFKKNQSTQVTKDLYIKAANICIEATTNITIKVGQSHIAIESGGIKIGTTGEIKVESTGPTEVKATAPLKLESSAKADLKSPMSTVAGDGMLTLKGGLVKIN
jgi:type VI secretion system secreted protein VgrG